MNKVYVYICILLMGVVTYIIRVFPLVVFRKPITNKFFKSFLYYAPYVTLSVLAFPAVLYCTGSFVTSVCGFICAVILSLLFGNFVITAFSACFLVFILQLFM